MYPEMLFGTKPRAPKKKGENTGTKQDRNTCILKKEGGKRHPAASFQHSLEAVDLVLDGAQVHRLLDLAVVVRVHVPFDGGAEVQRVLPLVELLDDPSERLHDFLLFFGLDKESTTTSFVMIPLRLHEFLFVVGRRVDKQGRKTFPGCVDQRAPQKACAEFLTERFDTLKKTKQKKELQMKAESRL